MKQYLIILSLAVVPLFPSGGYDHGTSTGKGLLELDFTWNPFNIFEQGQSYVVLGYGFTDRLDIHGYYSYIHDGADNYYGGMFYQFLDSKHLDLATAIGVRTIRGFSQNQLFMPQLLYTIHLSKKTRLGGSFVTIKNKSRNIGTTVDMFFSREVYENEKINLSHDVQVQIIKYDFYDSALIIKTPGLKILNLNDCPMREENEINKFRKKHGYFDTVLSQYSYAAWKGGANNKIYRENAAKEKLESLERQATILNCKTLIPFANFVYFSNELNSSFFRFRVL